MKYGYTIIYVADVETTVEFYKSAFGFETRFMHEEGGYAELETGGTVLAFAAFSVAESVLPSGFQKLADMEKPAGMEIGLVTDDVPTTVSKAVDAGAKLLAEPVEKPWGQTVAYVRGPAGELIEICTPIGG